MPVGDFTPAPKPGKWVKVKPTQKQMGDISAKVDKQLKERSKGICEVKIKCKGARAVQRAHTKGRRTIPHKTTVDDLFHACLDCHNWLDQTPEGIRFNRKVREVGTTQYLKARYTNGQFERIT